MILDPRVGPPRIPVQFFDDRGQHEYAVHGNVRPSVTTILEAEGLSGCAFWKEEDRRRGSAVHKIALIIGKRPIRGRTVEEVIANSNWDPTKTGPALVGYGYAVARWYLDTGFQPVLVEEPVASDIWQICGTLDVWGFLPDGRRLLPDFKSGEPQAAAWVQTALYAMLVEETYGLQTDLRMPVWLKRDGSYKAYPPRPAGGTDLIIGQNAINLWRWRRQYGMLG